MGEREPPDFFSERFDLLRPVQEALEQRGYFFFPIEKEHIEGLVTAPLLHRLHTTIKKRGFRSVAAHVALTFSGFARDPREVYEIPEARAWWRALDTQLPELPALLASLPEFRYNGPGMALTLLGDIDLAVERPDIPGYDVHVLGAERLIADALRRIRQAGQKYRLSETAVRNLEQHFLNGATQRL
jgi:chlororespiratory reduction 6-like protein^